MVLLADDDDGKGTWDDRPSSAAAAGRRIRRRGAALDTHHVDSAGLRIERQRSRAIHRLKILLDLEAGRGLFLDDVERAVPLRAEGFHRLRVERRTVRRP